MNKQNYQQIDKHVKCSRKHGVSMDYWKSGLKALQQKSVSRSGRRFVYREYSRGTHPDSILQELIVRNDIEIESLLDEICASRKVHAPIPVPYVPYFGVPDQPILIDCAPEEEPEEPEVKEEHGILPFQLVKDKFHLLSSRKRQDETVCYKTSTGAFIPVTESDLHPSYLKRGGELYLVLHVLDPLKGGNPPKTRPKKKKRKRTPKPMVSSVQLGQINRYVPFDKPIELVLRYNGVLTTDGSGTLSVRFSTCNPLRAFNGSGAYVNAVEIAGNFDEYRPRRWTIQVEPSPNGPTKGAIVTSFDRDANDLSTPNYANTLNYGNYRIFNAGAQFELSSKIPKIASAYDFTTDPPTGITVHQGGWIDAASPGVPGCCFMNGINLGNSLTIASFVLTMLTQWRFRR